MWRSVEASSASDSGAREAPQLELRSRPHSKKQEIKERTFKSQYSTTYLAHRTDREYLKGAVPCRCVHPPLAPCRAMRQVTDKTRVHQVKWKLPIIYAIFVKEQQNWHVQVKDGQYCVPIHSSPCMPKISIPDEALGVEPTAYSVLRLWMKSLRSASILCSKSSIFFAKSPTFSERSTLSDLLAPL